MLAVNYPIFLVGKEALCIVCQRMRHEAGGRQHRREARRAARLSGLIGQTLPGCFSQGARLYLFSDGGDKVRSAFPPGADLQRILTRRQWRDAKRGGRFARGARPSSFDYPDACHTRRLSQVI